MRRFVPGDSFRGRDVRHVAGRRARFLGTPRFFNHRIMLIAPATVATIVLMGFPLIFLVYLSFHSWFLEGNSAPVFTGVSNYQFLTQDPRFVSDFVNTLYFAGLGLAVQLPLGVAIGVLLSQKFPGANAIRALMILPMVATPVAIGLVWTIMMDPSLGVLKYFLSVVHLPSPGWLSNPRIVIPALVIVDAWEWTPMISLLTMAGLASLPVDPHEAAIVDGATVWQRFWRISMPLLWPTLASVIALRAMDLLKVIDIIFIMTRGGPGQASETLNVYNYLMGLYFFREGYASTIALILAAMVVVISMLVLRMHRVVIR